MSDSVRVAKDKVVQFTYQITDEKQDVLEPMDFPMTCVLGRHERLYDRVEAAMLGLPIGGEVSVELPLHESAWGEPDPSLIFTDNKQSVPLEYHAMGAEVEFKNENGEAKIFRVVDVDDTKVTFDGNHPFAGKVVTYHVKILDVRDATEQELAEGIETDLTQQAAEMPSKVMH